MRGVQAIDAAFNDDANMAEYKARFHPNHPVGKVRRDFMANYAQITPMMRVSVPVILFIDRKGVIRAQYFGNDPFFTPEAGLKDKIKAELDKLLLDDKPPVKKHHK
jgi:hypothetical protein